VTSRYKLSEKAAAQLTEIYTYGSENWGEAAADRYYYALIERFRKIAERPYLYPPVDHIHKGYRRSVYGEESIYYRIDGDTVEIMAVLGSQNIDTSSDCRE
jgi:toxin ParE1/3/4